MNSCKCKNTHTVIHFNHPLFSTKKKKTAFSINQGEDVKRTALGSCNVEVSIKY